jgi:hypothetical protein
MSQAASWNFDTPDKRGFSWDRPMLSYGKLQQLISLSQAASWNFDTPDKRGFSWDRPMLSYGKLQQLISHVIRNRTIFMNRKTGGLLSTSDAERIRFKPVSTSTISGAPASTFVAT